MISSGLVYRCSGGETFDSVALAIYGDEKYACELLNANPSLSTIPVFSGSEILEVPVVEVAEENGEEYMPPDAPWKE